MLDDLIFALRNFRRNKIRSFLSLLGIIIGVASVIVITSLSQSATKTVEDSFSSAGLDLVEISAGFMQRRRNATITFNETFRENLFDAVANIKSIHYTNSLSMTLSRGETTVTTGATAIEPGYLEINGLSLEQGADFSISDNVTGQQRIIIGAEIAQGLFADEDPIGQIVTVVAGNATFSFRVAGVLSGSNAMNPTDSIVLIPRGFYAKKIMPAAQASTIIVQCTHQDRAPTVAEHIKEYITFVSGSEHAASVTSMQALLEEYQELSGSISLILSGIAAISLLVALCVLTAIIRAGQNTPPAVTDIPTDTESDTESDAKSKPNTEPEPNTVRKIGDNDGAILYSVGDAGFGYFSCGRCI